MSLPDLVRSLTIGADLWLVALLLRILWLRRRTGGMQGAHVSNLTTMAFTGYVMLNLADRADHLGDDWSIELVGSIVCVTLGIVGVLRRVKVGVERPDGRKRWVMEDRDTNPR